MALLKNLSNAEFDFIEEAISKTYTLDEISTMIDLHSDSNLDLEWDLYVTAFSQRCVDLNDEDFEREVKDLSYSEQDCAWSQRAYREE